MSRNRSFDNAYWLYMQGPWLVEQECPGLFHNNLRAAEGKNQPNGKNQKCICPRGQQLRETALAARAKQARELAASRRGTNQPAKQYRLERLVYFTNVKQRRIPDLSKGLCQTEPAYRRVLELVIAEKVSENAISSAREVCDECPIQEKCGMYALTGEDPSGSWGGMYGGLMPKEREKITQQWQKEKEGQRGDEGDRAA
jgi:hypothetical protein